MSKQVPAADIALDDPQYYPTKDWRDQDVTEPGDMNKEILVWEISPSLEGGRAFIRPYKEALDYLKQVVEHGIVPSVKPDGTFPEDDCEVTMRLVKMPLGEYIAVEGEEC